MKRVVSCLLAVMVCILNIFPVFAAEKTKTVRIACNYNDFLRVSDDGSVSGFYAEYLSELAQTNNWKYEYIESTWASAVEMLEEGEIDFLFPTNYIKEREKTMDFSTLPAGYSAVGVFAMENSSYAYEDFSSYDGAKIAISKGSSNETEFKEYAEKNDFTYQPVYIDSNEKIIEALHNGSVDLGVFSAANECPDGVLVSVMEPQPVYFVVRKGNSEMLEEINSGMQFLIKNNTELVAEAMRKSLFGNNTGTFAFSKDEIAFIQSQQKIKIGFCVDAEPLSFVKEDGTYDGIYINLLNYLAEKTGVNIELYPIEHDKVWTELIKDGTIDFYIGASPVVSSYEDGVVVTNPVMSYNNIIVTKNDVTITRIESPTAAVTSDSAYWQKYIKENIGEDVKIKIYETTKDCMDAVSRGEADLAMLNNLEFNYHSKNDRLSSLIQWPRYRFATYAVLTASDNVDPLMISIINKSLNTLDSEYTDEIIDEYLSLSYHSYSAWDTIYNARLPLTAISVVVFALIVMIIVVGSLKRRQAKIREKAAKSERRQLGILAALSNNYLLIYYTDLDKNEVSVIRLKESVSSRIPDGKSYTDSMREYISSYVLPEYRDALFELSDTDNVIERFKNEPSFTVRYCAPDAENNSYFYEMEFVDISENESEKKMVFGVRCIDETIREEQEQQKLLQDALDGANRANVAKSEFLSRMSHDIRTPMNAIIGLTAIAQSHLDDQTKLRGNLDNISNASHHLLNLINDVLDMSKIESGKFNLNEENINLLMLLDNMLSIVRPQINEHNHILNVNVENIKHKNVIGDRLRIQQAFINLVSNAVKYTPDGGEIDITVREEPVSTPMAGCYVFVIKDNGIGMSEELMKNIFEPFTRSEDTRTSQIQGTGLGLSITRNIAQMMNGSIRVESQLGKGSTFTMTIFLKLTENQNDDEPEIYDKDLSVIMKSDFSGKRVLLTEDNEINREIATEILGMENIIVEAAVNGKEAVEKFESSEPGYYDMIFMDIQMPVMGGFEATKTIRSLTHPDAKSIPIVAMTANAFVEDIQASKNAGMNDHLAKPIDFEKLSEILTKYLGKKS